MKVVALSSQSRVSTAQFSSRGIRICPSYERDRQQQLWYRWWWSRCQHGQAIAEWLEAAEAGNPVHGQQDQGVLWLTYGADRREANTPEKEPPSLPTVPTEVGGYARPMRRCECEEGRCPLLFFPKNGKLCST
jgi:hypothetical protein